MLIQSLDNLNTYIMESGLHTPTENECILLWHRCHIHRKNKIYLYYVYYVIKHDYLKFVKNTLIGLISRDEQHSLANKISIKLFLLRYDTIITYNTINEEPLHLQMFNWSRFSGSALHAPTLLIWIHIWTRIT